MTDKTEWEVVDAPSEAAPQSPTHLLKSLLGPWWRWKIGAVAVIAAATLTVFAMVALSVLIVMAIATSIFLGIRLLLHWLHGDRPSTVTTLRRRDW